MNDDSSEDELNQWFSSYGFITAERILKRFNVVLAPKDQLIALKNPNSFFNRLIQAPLKNVLNGIILQQAHDYHVYVQKLYIDYLLSEESSKSEEDQGASCRESIENERLDLVTLGQLYHKKQIEHEMLISRTQATLIKACAQWSQSLDQSIKDISRFFNGPSQSEIKEGIIHALIECESSHYKTQNSRIIFVDKLTQSLNYPMSDMPKEQLLIKLSDLLDKVLFIDTTISELKVTINEMRQQARSFRQQFYDTALRVVELMSFLPEYKVNLAQDEMNRASLYLDNTIGN